MFECYDDINGFTQHDCICAQDNRPANYNISNSGLYLDSIAAINDLINTGECDKDMWTLLQQAEKDAVSSFVSDTNALLVGKNYQLKRPLSKDQIIGQIKSTSVFSNTKTYAVVRMNCAPVRGGFMTLKSVGGVFSVGSKNVVFTIVNNLGETVHTNMFTTIYKKYAKVDVNLKLPLFNKFLQPLEYYIYYPFSNDFLPMDTEVDCGCGKYAVDFNSILPTYNTSRYRGKWTDFLMVGGVEIDALSELDDLDGNAAKKMYGLVLDLDFTCDVSEVICKDSLDFTGNPLALSTAYAILYKTALNAANGVLASKNMSWENLVGRETWEEIAIMHQAKYTEHVNFIVSSVDHTTNDCLACKDVIQMTRRGLFS